MSSQITIEGTRGKLVIEIIQYENERATNIDDANWLLCSISVAVDSFAGDYQAAVSTEELEELKNVLSDCLRNRRGSVNFATDEDNLKLTITTDKLGGSQLRADCMVLGPPAVTLSFSTDIDQSFLQRAFKDVENALLMFPGAIGDRPQLR